MLDKYCKAQKDLFSGVLHDIYNFQTNKMAAKMTFTKKSAKNIHSTARHYANANAWIDVEHWDLNHFVIGLQAVKKFEFHEHVQFRKLLKNLVS